MAARTCGPCAGVILNEIQQIQSRERSQEQFQVKRMKIPYRTGVNQKYIRRDGDTFRDIVYRNLMIMQDGTDILWDVT